MILSCAAEESNPVISRDYHLLRRMIDTENSFIEVTALGEELAMDVIRYARLQLIHLKKFAPKL